VQAQNAAKATPAAAGRDPRVGLLDGNDPTRTTAIPPTATAYLLVELRCAVLRARLVQADLEAIGIALKAGFISPAQAVSHLDDCDLLRLVGVPREPS
jgi:hypothetical protein